MKYTHLYVIALAALFVSVPAKAQQLKLTVKDKQLQEQTMMVSSGNFQKPTFDEKGTCTFSKADITEPVDATIMINGYMFPVLLEQGKTAMVSVKGTADNLTPEYKGDNADCSRFLYEYLWFSPKIFNNTFEDIDDDELRQEAEKREREPIDFDKETADNQSQYQKTMRAAKAVKNAERSAQYQKLTELKYLRNRIDLRAERLKSEGKDPKQDAEYMSLIKQIDANDIIGNDMILHLPQTLVETNLSTSFADRDLTAYGIDYIQTVSRLISNPEIKNPMLASMTGTLAGIDDPSKQFDFDSYWKCLKENADTSLISRLQYIADSKNATKQGAKCPDVTFSSPDGKQHRLSEYFGRVLYIDIWATWCAPCCAQIPYIEKHVEHYKDDPRIQFISISCDQNLEAWRKKLDKDRPQWPQFVCSNDEYRTLAKQWGITGIPRFIIINADGTINNANAFRPSEETFREKIDEIIK